MRKSIKNTGCKKEALRKYRTILYIAVFNLPWSDVGKKHHIAGILLLKQQFFSSQSDFEIPGYPQSVLDPGDTSHVKAVEAVEQKLYCLKTLHEFIREG